MGAVFSPSISRQDACFCYSPRPFPCYKLPRERFSPIGATSPFTRAWMKVGSPHLCGPPSSRRYNLRPGKPDGQRDRGEGNEAGQGFGKVLEVLGKTPVSSEPGEGALDHPAAPWPPQPQLAMRCSRRRPRRVRAEGSACGSCRGPARLHRGPGSRRSGRRPASAALRGRPGCGSCGP